MNIPKTQDNEILCRNWTIPSKNLGRDSIRMCRLISGLWWSSSMTSTNVLVLLKFWGGLFPDLIVVVRPFGNKICIYQKSKTQSQQLLVKLTRGGVPCEMRWTAEHQSVFHMYGPPTA